MTDEPEDDEGSFVELPFPWPPTSDMIGTRGWGDAKAKGLPFFYSQHKKPCVQCGSTIKLWSETQGQCAQCLVNKYQEGWQPGSGRGRGSASETISLKRALFAIVDELKPVTVRQVFYQATVRGLIEKTESGYGKVQRALADMRRDGELPFEWISDHTRWIRQPQTYDSPTEALEATAENYRKSLWTGIDCYVQIWLEKNALAGIIEPVTDRYDVPLLVAVGYSSLTFTHLAAGRIISADKPTFIYHLGDYDPSGVNAGENIESALRARAPDADISFERIAVTPAQIAEWGLPSRPTKTSDPRSWGFGDESVELDAMTPSQLRDLVEGAIGRHMDSETFDSLMEEEATERAEIKEMIEG